MGCQCSFEVGQRVAVPVTRFLPAGVSKHRNNPLVRRVRARRDARCARVRVVRVRVVHGRGAWGARACKLCDGDTLPHASKLGDVEILGVPFFSRLLQNDRTTNVGQTLGPYFPKLSTLPRCFQQPQVQCLAQAPDLVPDVNRYESVSVSPPEVASVSLCLSPRCIVGFRCLLLSFSACAAEVQPLRGHARPE